MKFVAILSLAIAVSADVSACPAYVCDPSGVTWADGVCAMLDANNTQIDLKSGKCGSDTLCPAELIASGLLSATPCATITDPQPTPAAFPGEKCDRLRLCIDGSACGADNTCPVPTGTCVNPQDCGLGKYCNTHADPVACAPQVAIGGSCYQDTDCVNNAGCDTTAGNQGKCVQYSSVAAGTQVQTCAGTTAALAPHYLCASGYCYETTTAGKFACAGSVANTVLPNRCGTTATTCKSTADSTSTLTLSPGCGCGYDGFYYCPLFAGDADMTTYLSEMQSFLGSSSLSNCNTARHGGSMSAFSEASYFWCGLNLTDSQAYHAMRASVYPQVVMASDCVIKILAPGYYKLEGSVSLLIGGLFLALLQ